MKPDLPYYRRMCEIEREYFAMAKIACIRNKEGVLAWDDAKCRQLKFDPTQCHKDLDVLLEQNAQDLKDKAQIYGAVHIARVCASIKKEILPETC